ncbi:MAG: enoyl-CoA hydratase-related protein [Candidatus Promineifilaceae bacterium]
MDENRTITEDIDGPIATVTLSRAEQHNAFNPDMVNALTESFGQLGRNKDVRVIILTGSGRSFCAGADLNSMKAAAENTYEDNLADAEAIFDLMTSINYCPHPVVGRINGAAIGGGVGLVGCCDITVAVDRARFGLSEARLGLVPAVISPFVIAKIGSSNARELFLTGERFDAIRAKEIGLVNHVVGEPQLDERIREIVLELMQSAPGAVTAAKQLIAMVTGRSDADLRTYTTKLIAKRRSSLEGREGISAFLEKREPWWRDHQ